MMMVKNFHGDPISLNCKELCLIWFSMTGMSFNDISLIMNFSERKVHMHIEKIKSKLKTPINPLFTIWFINNRSLFNNESVEYVILCRGNSV